MPPHNLWLADDADGALLVLEAFVVVLATDPQIRCVAADWQARAEAAVEQAREQQPEASLAQLMPARR